MSGVRLSASHIIRSAAIRNVEFIADSNKARQGAAPDAHLGATSRPSCAAMLGEINPVAQELVLGTRSGCAEMAGRNRLRRARVAQLPRRLFESFWDLTGRHANLLRSSHDDVPVQEARAARRASTDVQAARQL
jgi:hypothetical protein